MLTRYRIVRGSRREALPRGIRQDTRKHTRHILRPDRDAVARYLADPSDARWEEFRAAYLSALAGRLAHDPAPFEELAALARSTDVYLGCSCPTARNPDVRRCHTMLALRFMKRHFPDLEVVLPAA